MNTPAHLIFAAVAFARPHQRITTIAAIAGGLAPDISLYLMAGVSLFVYQLSPEYVFGTLYYSGAWQAVFAVDNSFILWGLGLLLAWRMHSPGWMIFAASGLLHLAFDFPLHNTDARQHFWPLTNWVFHSPVSYWDPRHYGSILSPIEMAVSLGLSLLLIRRFGSLRSRAVICAGVAVQLSPMLIWAVVFAGHHT
jgi:hypothetical protein